MTTFLRRAPQHLRSHPTFLHGITQPIPQLLRRGNHNSTLTSTPTPTLTLTTSTPDFAFAFDIDGVLLRGKSAHPRARQALSLLEQHRIEYLLLTNGGGQHESSRVAEISSRLGMNIHKAQFVQSHTPFQTQADGTQTILVVGGRGDTCRRVAHSYGWSSGRVLVPGDFAAAESSICPVTEPGVYPVEKDAPKPPRPRRGVTKVDAIFVYNDSRDWALDIQLIVDLLLAQDGLLGTRRSLDQVRAEGHIPLYFSNPDLWWASGYPLPRLGQGGFMAALQGVWRTITGGEELVLHTIGKPHEPTYRYAEDVLTEWRRGRMHKKAAKTAVDWVREKEREEEGEGKKEGGEGRGEGEGERGKLRRVYMVGDNPASDIAGANSFKSPRGTEWVSVLVRSGVFQDGDDSGGAKMIVGDVEEAVRWAIEREQTEGK